jgi:Domain of unknown function (DUF222)
MSQSSSAPPRPASEPTSWLDAPGTRPQPPADDAVPEGIGAGFTRDSDAAWGIVRGRVGFEAGGPADVMTPCSVLAELTGQARGRMGELSDDELIGMLKAARRVQSWQAAVELAAASELTARRMAEPVRPGPQPAQRAAAELAAALTLTRHASDELVSLAVTAERLDGVADALAAGLIDLAKAKVFADELAAVDWLTAFRIAAKILLDAPGLTTAQLRARLRRAVLAADPQAGRRRQRAAKPDARVQAWQEPSGNAGLAGRELPPASVLAADRHLTALARSLKAAGAQGTLDQIRVAVYLALLSGQDPASVLASLTADRVGSDDRRAETDSTAGAPGPVARDTAGAESACAPHTTDQAHSADQSRAADPDLPLPEPPESDCPDLGFREPDFRDPEVPDPDIPLPDPPEPDFPDPDLLGPDFPGADMRDPVSQDPGAGTPDTASKAISWPSGPRGSIHLTMPLSAWLGQTNNPGEIARLGPADAWTCRDIAGSLARQPRTRYCLTITDDTGQAAGHACARRAPPPQPGQARQWLANLKVHWFTATAGCDHALETQAYRPGARLAHLTQVRMRTCTAPGCNRPAETCDLDHVVAHDKGGRTCSCNLHPACRRHHQLKQHPGWRIEMPEPGQVTWHLPHGRSYTTAPEPYPI